ncbi:MAG: SpoIID/LytB domain-containing protein [Chlamydiales bacterium]|jgi:stage II sporulation protein D|nr:SpoIID/LytB domain-containing protein [Chlamydiales bacterium]
MKLLLAFVTFSFIAHSLCYTKESSINTQTLSDISKKDKPPTIKILLHKDLPQAFLEAKGRYFVYNPQNDFLLASGIYPKKQPILSQEAGLKWGELFPGISQIRLVPGNPQSTILVNGIEYKGCVEIYDIKGKLHIINEIDIENYLRSVLHLQSFSELDEEVMDALAIIARTKAYYLANKDPLLHWHVTSSEIDYQGSSLVCQNPNIPACIFRTRNMILTYQSAPFEASWTEDSAGKTASFSHIFRKNSTTPSGVDSPIASAQRENHNWSFVISKQQLAHLLDVKSVQELDLYRDADSHKVYAIRYRNGNEYKQMDFFTLQKKLGVKLKSNDFTIDIDEKMIRFTGHGKGHGVGLCLFSAICMAKNAKKTPEILSHFFPNTKLEYVERL